MNRMGGMCFNWKVLAGLGVIGLGIWTVAPNLIWAALPLLLLAACPLSMLFMMRGMSGGQCSTQPTQPTQASQPARTALSREEQLAELKVELAKLQVDQMTFAREITRLEAMAAATEQDAASTPAVREAEAVARAADQRVQGRP